MFQPQLCQMHVTNNKYIVASLTIVWVYKYWLAINMIVLPHDNYTYIVLLLHHYTMSLRIINHFRNSTVWIILLDWSKIYGPYRKLYLYEEKQGFTSLVETQVKTKWSKSYKFRLAYFRYAAFQHQYQNKLFPMYDDVWYCTVRVNPNLTRR